MGVPQFLAEILQTAGRPVDLQIYAHGIRPLHVQKDVGAAAAPATTTTSVAATPSVAVSSSSARLRPLRIGIDVSTWIYRAAQGYSEMLGDEKHLSNYGRATLLLLQQQEPQAQDQQQQQQPQPQQPLEHRQTVQEYVTTCAMFVVNHVKRLQSISNAEVLVVLDGATPPIKQQAVRQRAQKRREAETERDRPVQEEDVAGTMDSSGNQQSDLVEERRIRAFRRAGAGQHYDAIISDVLLGLRENLIPFLVAPYEADGQLAWLSHQGYIDLIITEDSDLAGPYGASPVLYKVADSIRAGEAKGILLRRQDLAANPGKVDLLDFSPAMLAVVFVATGSDYCRKLKGIGLVTAVDIVRTSFFEINDNDQPPLANVFRSLYSRMWESDLTPNEQEEYESAFLAALIMYRHPVIFDPIHVCCCTVGAEGDPELMSHQPYADLFRDEARRANIVGVPFKPVEAAFIAEGWIAPKTRRPRPNAKLPDYVLDYVEKTRQDDTDNVEAALHTQSSDGGDDQLDSNGTEAHGVSVSRSRRKRQAFKTVDTGSKRAATGPLDDLHSATSDAIVLDEDDNMATQPE